MQSEDHGHSVGDLVAVGQVADSRPLPDLARLSQSRPAAQMRGAGSPDASLPVAWAALSADRVTLERADST